MKRNRTRDDTNYGVPKRSLTGHSHIVSDCVQFPRTPYPPYPPMLPTLSRSPDRHRDWKANGTVKR